MQCTKAGIECKYLNKIMTEASVDNGAAKQVILAIMNGGEAA